MKRDNADGPRFPIRSPQLQGENLFKEVFGNAFALYQWCVSNICSPEYDYKGKRIGLVLGFEPLHDASIAGYLRERGTRCEHKDVARWRKTLASYGAIACVSSHRNEQTIFVIESDKFPERDTQYLPWFAADAVQRALTLRYAGETARQLLSQIRGAFESLKTDRIPSTQLVSILKSTGVEEWRQLTVISMARALRELDKGIFPKNYRIKEKVTKCYNLKSFQAAFDHYLVDGPA